VSEYQVIHTDDIDHAPFNPRRLVTDDPKTAELAKSIQAVGLLQPVIVRKIEDRYQLLAGARRLEATKLAGFEDIEARVLELDDDQALDVTVTENLQRADLTPLEEGRGIASLLASGRSVTAVASNIAKSEAWVRRRAKLASLPEEWQTAVTEPLGSLSYFSAAHLELIAHLPPKMQGELLEYCLNDGSQKRELTLTDLKRWIGDHAAYIADAPWITSDGVTAVQHEPMEVSHGKNMCQSCYKRSDCDVDLFTGLNAPWEKSRTEADAKCLDEECWNEKKAAFVAYKMKIAKKTTKREPLKITTLYNTEGAIQVWSTRECDPEAPNAVPAVHIDGNEIGKLVWIEKPTADGKAGARKEDPKPEATLEQKRVAYQCQMLDAWLEKQEKCPPALRNPVYMLAAVAMYGYSAKHFEDDADWVAEFNSLTTGVTDDELIGRFWKHLREFPLQQCQDDAIYIDDWAEKKLRLAVEVCGLDFQDFVDGAEKEFPDETKTKPAKGKKGGKK
jgi:ParB/RepB/Spo0J family partition protein